MSNATPKGVKLPCTVRASPSPEGEGRGEGERFLESYFRSRRPALRSAPLAFGWWQCRDAQFGVCGTELLTRGSRHEYMRGCFHLVFRQPFGVLYFSSPPWPVPRTISLRPTAPAGGARPRTRRRCCKLPGWIYRGWSRRGTSRSAARRM